jgi:hypothetical protein
MTKGAKLTLVLSVFIFAIIIFAVNSAIKSYEKEPAVTAPAQTRGPQGPVSAPPDSRERQAEKSGSFSWPKIRLEKGLCKAKAWS